MSSAPKEELPVLVKSTQDKEEPKLEKDIRLNVKEDRDLPPSSTSEADKKPSDGNCTTADCGKGVPFTEIRQGYGVWGPPPLPPVQPSSRHVVLFKVPWRPNQMPDPYPNTPCDRWDQDHVRMPHSSQSLYPVQESEDEKGLRMRWELIQEALLRNILTSHQLESAILSYNSRYNERWNFTALHSLFNEVLEKEDADYFFKNVLPSMAQLALQLPDLITGPIPLLKKHRNQSISLTQVQIASLLANAFFCTFPRRNSTKRGSEYSTYPDINFNRLYQCGDIDSSSVLEKLKCILNYFRRICVTAPEGVVTFSRRYIPTGSCPKWSESTKALPKFHIRSSGRIEDEGSGMLQVDFANKYVGGGVLGWGCVQEEIRFVICPELIVSRLFTECLDATEALLIVGCERFSTYSGYGHSFEWVGDFVDETPPDCFGRKHCSIVAMDALCFSSVSSQYSVHNLIREVNKAFVGFCETEDADGNTLSPIATGNWGCGAFRGDAHLKSLIQIIAAGEAGRSLVYFTFGDQNLCDRIYEMYKFLVDQNFNIGKLWRVLCKYERKLLSAGTDVIPDLYDFIYSHKSEGPQATDPKPSMSVKQKVLESKPKTVQSNSHANLSHCDSSPKRKPKLGSGMTEEDLDKFIEEYDSDSDDMDVVNDCESSKKPDPQEVTSNCNSSRGSCLLLIEESLQKNQGDKGGFSEGMKDQHRLVSKPPKSKSLCEIPCEVGVLDATTNISGEAMDTSSIIVISPSCAVSEDNRKKCATSSGVERAFPNSSDLDISNESATVTKRGNAPKRKISDYFNPM